MPRPICWICGNQLFYIKGVPVYAEIVDPIDVVHRVHKVCKKEDDYQKDKDATNDFRIRHNNRDKGIDG